jgi:hypothetical protein
MVQDIVWKADSHSACHTVAFFMETEGSLPRSQKPTTGPYPEPAESSLLSSCQRICLGPRQFETFRNTLLFYGEGLLAPHSTPKLQDHPLSAVRDCLFSIFAATLHVWRPSPFATSRHAVVTRNPPNMVKCLSFSFTVFLLFRFFIIH